MRTILICNGGPTWVQKAKKPLSLIHSTLLLSAMSIDSYGLPSEQYEEFFEDNVTFAAKLYVKACQILRDNGAGAIDFKTTLDLYQEAIYGTNDDCRKYQKTNNPEAIKDNDIFSLTTSREELMEEIQAVNVKVEALVDYIARLVETTTDGLNGLAEVMDKKG
jgi:hypothetical protein